MEQYLYCFAVFSCYAETFCNINEKTGLFSYTNRFKYVTTVSKIKPRGKKDELLVNMHYVSSWKLKLIVQKKG